MMKSEAISNVVGTFRRYPLLIIAVIIGFLVRLWYDAVSVLSGEFINWVSTATVWVRSFSGGDYPWYLGIYTGGAYMFTLAYRLWLVLPVEHPSFESVYIWPAGPGHPPVFQPSLASYIFVLSMKLPTVMFDALVLLLIAHVVSSKTNSIKTALIAAATWAWNPLVTLLENYNGIDAAPAFFLLLAAYLFERRRTTFLSVALAIGTLLRLAPVMFLPTYALEQLRKRQWLGLVKLFAPGAFLIAIPVIVYTKTYGLGILEEIIRQRPGLLVYEALAFMGPALKPRLGVAWNGFIAFNLLQYFLLVALMSSRRESSGFGDEISSVLLAFFATSGFHYAFFLWLLPFLTIDNIGLNRRFVLYCFLTLGGLLWTTLQASTAVFSFGTSILFIPVSSELQPLSRTLATLQFYKGLEFIRAFLSGVLLAQLALIVSRNLRKATNSQLTRFVPGNGGRARSIQEEQRYHQDA